jgi:flagellar protein FlaI
MGATMNTSAWWGGFGRGYDPLTILDLVRNNTLDVKTAALLWVLVEERLSIIVGSSPMMAGKTTLLSALVDLMPPRFEKIYARGIREDFSFLGRTNPSSTYIMIPEISSHTPAYMWGDGLRTVFRAMSDGYGLASTMHADTPEDVIWMLDGYPMHLPHEQLSKIGVIVNIRLLYGEQDVARRVNNVTMVGPGPSFATVVKWDRGSDTFIHTGLDETAAPIKEKSDILESWMGRGKVSAEDVGELVAAYYARGHG